MSSESEESPGLKSESSFCYRESFHSQYIALKTIGQGGYAKVKLAYHRLTGTPVAVKVLHKKKLWCNPVMSEVDIMMKINHPNIISLLQVIESATRIYLVMELAEGQQLYHYIRKAGHLQEEEARGIFRQILSAVSYCHELGIVHRDLKPDNIMLDRNGKVKIIDFGLSTQVKPGQRLNFHCGTYSFGAPELLRGKFYDGTKIDVWSLGVVLYFMVVGKVPFGAVSTRELRRQVVAGKYTVPLNMSELLQDLLSRLMTVNPKFRPTVTEVMTHPWLREDLEASTNQCEEMVPSLPDPAIVEAMEYMGFQAQDIKDSLRQRKYNQTMASYCLLQEQSLRRQDFTTPAQPMNPGATPFPSFEDPDAFPLELRRRGSEPALGTLLRGPATSGHVPAYGLQAGQRGSRHPAGSALPLCRPLQRPSTPDQTHQCTKSAPCIYSTSSIWENTEDVGSHGPSAEDKPTHRRGQPRDVGSHSPSAEDKPTHRRGQPRGLKGWTRRIGSALMRLCCCFPSRKKPRLGQNRVSPQK
ncbi:sperm motility kinase 2B-like [Arvicola amphibius]|uniref:sperm motility kinase 2B-like n=1 Tax=Arvicola amphibius TaxID=1047088 RepID=UPI0018E2F8FC|nr:sperm motility kinase 2B-like [Arvicola amphibius]